MALIDSAGSEAALVMHYVCWDTQHGVMYASVGSTQFQDSAHLPYIGTAVVRIERLGDTVSVYWDGEMILSGTEGAEVDSVDLSFWRYLRPGAYFGPESVDYVTVTAPETAEESASWSRIKAMFGR